MIIIIIIITIIIISFFPHTWDFVWISKGGVRRVLKNFLKEKLQPSLLVCPMYVFCVFE